MSDEDHGGFTYRGKTWMFGGKATMGELAWAERRLGIARGSFTPHEMMIVAYWLTITRAEPSRPKADVWQEIWEAEENDFGDVPGEPAPDEEPELPEDQWPLDPTGAGTETVPPSGSGPNDPSAPSA